MFEHFCFISVVKSSEASALQDASLVTIMSRSLKMLIVTSIALLKQPFWSSYIYVKIFFGFTFDTYIRSFQTNVVSTKVKLVFLCFKITPEITKLEIFSCITPDVKKASVTGKSLTAPWLFIVIYCCLERDTDEVSKFQMNNSSLFERSASSFKRHPPIRTAH